MQQVSFYGFLKMKERNAIRDILIKKISYLSEFSETKWKLNNIQCLHCEFISL